MCATLLDGRLTGAALQAGASDRARRDWAVPATLAALSGLVHVPLLRPTPINWDAVQFVLALDRFDLHHHQPHPPGYILYVALGRALGFLAADPSMRLSLLSVAFSVLATILAYRLALDVFGDRAVAAGSALLLALSPLTLYYGSTGLTYAPEMALSLGIAGLAWRLRLTGSVYSAAGLALALGISGGVRQTSLVVMLPLCAWALWGKPPRNWLVFGPVTLATCLAWAVPLLMLSGGLQAYLHESELLAAVASSQTSVVTAGAEGLLYDLTFIGLALGVGLGFAMLPLGLWAARVSRFSLERTARGFLAWWIVPPLAFFAVSHVGQYGYAMVVLPPLLMLAALSLRVLAELHAPQRWRAHVTVVLCSALALASVGYFALAQGPVTASNITKNDDRWHAIESTLAGYDPSSTILLADANWEGSFREAGYLLPRFHVYGAGKDPQKQYGWLYSAFGGQSTYSLPHPPAQEQLTLPEGTRDVVLLDDRIAGKLLRARDVQEITVPLPGGSQLYLLQSESGSIQELSIDRNAPDPQP